MSKQPVSPPPPDRPAPSAPPPPPSWRHWIWPVALLAAVLLYLYLPAVHGEQPVSLDYSQFIADASAHKVRDISFESPGSGNNTPATGTLTSGKSYTTVIPGAPSTQLTTQLAADGVKITAQPPTSGFGSVLLSWLIILLPLALGFWLIRRMARAGAAGYQVHRRGRVRGSQVRDRRGGRLPAEPGALPAGRRDGPARRADGRAAGHRQDAAGPGGSRRGIGGVLLGRRVQLRGDVRRRGRLPGP